jgi:hypothetical protein
MVSTTTSSTDSTGRLLCLDHGEREETRCRRGGYVRQHALGLYEARLPRPGGKSKSFYAKTQKEAIAKRNAARGSFSTHNLDAEKMSVEAYLASWLFSISSSVSESTHKRYEQAVRVQIVPEIGG